MLDSVLFEELSYLEVRDAIKAGKTTALIIAGSVEQNGPYLATGKHNYMTKPVGEAIARKLGNAIVAPLINLEAGDPNTITVPGNVKLSKATYKAVITDIATSLKVQGFKTFILLGDSGGNIDGLREVTEELNTKWKTDARAYYVHEYYDWDAVRKFVVDSGIPEKLNSDGIHDEYAITAMMMAADPDSVHLDQRIEAKKTTINGVSILPKEKTIEMGKKIVEFRANMAVAGIRKALGQKSN
jgi:creatinine amidohydrolase/Fe(II)-dependent formamide hydrolase-like protein